jgi:hypothetical protein
VNEEEGREKNGKDIALEMKEQERGGEKKGKMVITVPFLYISVLHIFCSSFEPEIPKNVSNSHYDNLYKLIHLAVC